MTAMCTSGVMVPPPGIPTQDVLPLATVVSTVKAVSESTPFVVPPAPVVERSGTQAQEFLTCRLSESLKFHPLFRLSSSPPSPTLPWGAAYDLSPPFSLGRVQMGHSQEVPGEDSSFSVSPLSPGLFFKPPRGSTSPPAGGTLLPTTADGCVVSGLGDPITAAWCEQYPGSESPWSLPVCVAVRLILSAGPSGASDWVGFEDICSTAGGILDLCTSHGLGAGWLITDWTAESSVQILGVRWSRVEYVCRVVYLWCTVCFCSCHLWRALPYSAAPTVCIRLAGSLHIECCARSHMGSLYSVSELRGSIYVIGLYKPDFLYTYDILINGRLEASGIESVLVCFPPQLVP